MGNLEVVEPWLMKEKAGVRKKSDI